MIGGFDVKVVDFRHLPVDVRQMFCICQEVAGITGTTVFIRKTRSKYKILIFFVKIFFFKSQWNIFVSMKYIYNVI
jgi:hypothetical protein